MDLRAKLARLRSTHAPAAATDPPPWAAPEPEPARGEVLPKLDRIESLRQRMLALGVAPASDFERPESPPRAAGVHSPEPAGSGVLFERPKPSPRAAGVYSPAPAESGVLSSVDRIEALRARMQALSKVAPADELPALAESKPERIAQLRALIAGVAARNLRDKPEAPAPVAHAPPPWVQEATPHGPLHVCTRYLEPDHHHGHAPVRAGLRELPGTIASLVCDPEYAALDLSRALYLDTETTGLAGGTGTIAFLVGLARFEDSSLCVEQLVVPQLGTEKPMLVRLAERLAAASCIVTYNGKSFDWPLLRTRFVLARLPVPELPPHIDLLHVCRRLWKQRLPSVRLVDMERQVLRFEREDDLPGSEIPARYFEFLRGGSPDRLCPVLEHNQNDIIALAALLGALMRQYAGELSLCDSADALHFGKLALRARDLERARSFGSDAVSHSVCEREAHAALTLCAEIEHKLGRIPEAIALLERAVEHAEAAGEALAAAQLHFMLAKLYEHEQHDLARALRHARNTEPVEGPSLHGRRLGRLYRRLLRSAAGPAP
jgi:uncharacterized protein